MITTNPCHEPHVGRYHLILFVLIILLTLITPNMWEGFVTERVTQKGQEVMEKEVQMSHKSFLYASLGVTPINIKISEK